jgi:hypothetical protein
LFIDVLRKFMFPKGKNNRLKLLIIVVFVCALAIPFLQKFAAAEVNQKETPSQSIEKRSDEPVEGCLKCHSNIEPMHKFNARGEVFETIQNGKDALGLSCTSCHGGNPAAIKQEEAHVQPKFPKEWNCKDKKCSSKNPERTNTLLARESREFVRFINPSDFRAIKQSCGECHSNESYNSARSMMAHGSMLWGAALYNNGSFPLKDARFGESYNENGFPQSLIQNPQPTREQQMFEGILSFIEPLPRWEISQPGNILRVFERGGKRRLEVALPDKEEENGKPDKNLSPRGLGTANRTDPVFLGLQKTRLLDPTLNFLGTNDHPGDYRSSGCASCHVVYANDRSALASDFYAQAGNEGKSQSSDTSIPKNESGHPIKHQFTTKIPTAQCMVCHMHPGTNMVATYLGYTWWDNETDGKSMYPQDKQIDPSQREEAEKLEKNPEGASLRGLWSDLEFLKRTGTTEFNKTLDRTQFADSHGHGWIFRAVYKKDRKGNLLDEADRIIDPNDPELFNKTVHLKDIHLEKGMSCIDCHFRQDMHGDGNLYNEPRAAIEIGCIDCHGSIQQRANGITSGFAAAQIENQNLLALRKRNNQPTVGQDLTRLQFRNESGKKVSILQILSKDEVRKDETGADIQLKKGDVIQNSMMGNRWWRIKQTRDTVTKGNPDYNTKSAYAKTMQKDNETWGNAEIDESKLAHRQNTMDCYSCHTSFVTSCFGCHLSMEANRKMPNLHNEGGDSRNFTSYNFQVIRDDIFMLGRDGTVTGHRVTPVRSSSAVLVSSRNQNREWIYHQQQTVSAEGFSGQAFNTHVPHTVRAKETRQCSDCHVSDKNDNNAWLAQVMLQGTNFVNFMGRYVYVAATDSLEAVAVTEHSEPQAVYGSNLHKLAYKDNYEKFVRQDRELKEYYENKGRPKALQVQVRGEYAYVAAGEGGLRIYDVAQIDNKGFSERIVTAPVSPLGQKFYVDTKYAAAVAAPSTLAVDPARWRTVRKEDGTLTQIPPDEANKLHAEAKKMGKPSPLINEEEPIHPLYAYLYVADRDEGLILVNAATLLDGEPRNNFLERALTFNPDGVLSNANNIMIAGNFAYVTTNEALVIVSIETPLSPKVVQKIPLNSPKAVAIQFRYAFVVDADGLKVLNISELATNGGVSLIEKAKIPLRQARDIYVARTYAYVANGEDGVAIIDVEKAEIPKLLMSFNADGKINDARSVKVAMTNASLYAYVADGKNGLRVLQLTDPETMPEFAGFSPTPKPNLIATFKTKGEAVSLSKGLDRDRAVDESGNQIAVFGRRGARPFNLEEMLKMQRANDGKGEFFKVSDRVKKSKVDPAKPVAGFLDYLKSFWLFGAFGIGFLLVYYKIRRKW